LQGAQNLILSRLFMEWIKDCLDFSFAKSFFMSQTIVLL
jgi:hypothetical protein